MTLLVFLGFSCDSPDTLYNTMNEVRDQSNDIAREIQNLKDQLDRLASQGGGSGGDNGGIPGGTSKA